MKLHTEAKIDTGEITDEHVFRVGDAPYLIGFGDATPNHICEGQSPDNSVPEMGLPEPELKDFPCCDVVFLLGQRLDIWVPSMYSIV